MTAFSSAAPGRSGNNRHETFYVLRLLASKTEQVSEKEWNNPSLNRCRFSTEICTWVVMSHSCNK